LTESKLQPNIPATPHFWGLLIVREQAMTVVALVFTYCLVLAPWLIPYGLILWVCVRLTRAKPLNNRAALIAGISTLLFTPVWGPATIAVVPVSLGMVLVVSAATLSWSSLVDTVGLTPAWWYLVALPATALIAYGVARHLLSNNSSKPTPLRGAS